MGRRLDRREAGEPDVGAMLLCACEDVGRRVIADDASIRGRIGAGEWSADELARRVWLACARAMVRSMGVVCAEDDATALGSEVASACIGALSWSDAAWPVRPEAIGYAYERLLARDVAVELDAGAFRLSIGGDEQRRRRGAFFTPPELVTHLVEQGVQALIDAGPDGVRGLRVCDPTCGAGHVLLGVARRLADHLAPWTGAARSRAIRDVVTTCLYGADIDPCSAAVCRLVLELEAGGGVGEVLSTHIVAGDSLLGAPRDVGGDREAAARWCAAHLGDSWPDRLVHWHVDFPEIFDASGKGGFDAVIGNPPFLSQLARATTASRDAAGLLRAKSEGVVQGYSDISAAFLWESVRISRSGGRVALVQPLSVLATRDAGRVRASIAREAALTSLWVTSRPVFDASVLTCVPAILKGGARRGWLHRSRGPAFESMPDVEIDMDVLAAQETWSPLAAEAWGVPRCVYHTSGTIGDLADATADFRDEYYGLAGCIVEDEDVARGALDRFPALVTSGLIDLAELRWGSVTTRIHKRAWRAPRVDRAALAHDARMAAWIERRLVPKILLATQTRAVELIVDEAGELLPTTPTISVTVHDPASIWLVAAALASPVATAACVTRYAGSGMSAHALKLSASQLRGLPLPTDRRAWERAAKAIREAMNAPDDEARRRALRRFGHASLEAYDVDAEGRRALGRWWWRRARRRGPRSRATATVDVARA